jgi:hypothetical protein
VVIEGEGFDVRGARLPRVRFGEVAGHVVHASSRALTVVVPADAPGGRTPLRVEGAEGETAFVTLGTVVATGLHQVDNPAFDREGNLYLTYSGARGQQAAVSIYRVPPGGVREPFVAGIVNATSLAFDARDRLHVSSRFEGLVYRIGPEGAAEVAASDLGVTCGLAFAPDDTLYVGDRSGTVFRLTPSGQTAAFATLPPSVAAFHLAYGPDRALYVAGPTLSSHDPVYRIDQEGAVTVVHDGFGRPQGLAFDDAGILHVVDALAGSSGLYRVRPSRPPELVIAGDRLVGVAFGPTGGVVVASNETAYRLDLSDGAGC